MISRSLNSQSAKSGSKLVKFGDVVENANLAERDPESAGIERIVGLEHIDPENLHIRRWNTADNGTSFSRKFVPGQTLFGKRRAYQRKVAFAEFEGICSGDILTFEPKDPDVLVPELLPFICQTDAFFDHALGTSAGSLSPRTSYKALRDFEFSLPPIEEQKRIAEILWAADEAEGRYEEVIDNLNQLAIAIQNRAFTSYLDQAVRGLIPLVNLSKLLEEPIINGIFKKREHFGQGTLLVNVTDVYKAFRVDPNKLERVEANSKEEQTFSARAGDVIFNRSSLVLDGIGQACLVQEWDEPLVFECHLMRARPDATLVDPRFVCRYSLSDYGRRYLKSRARTTTMTTINQDDLGRMPIPVPNLDVQIRLSNVLDALEDRANDTVDHKIKSVTTKKRLLNQLWAGGDPCV